MLLLFSTQIIPCITQNLEAVQNRFFHFLFFKFKIECLWYFDYDVILFYLNLKLLNKRKNCLHYIFLLKLLYNFIDCPYFLEQIFELIRSI